VVQTSLARAVSKGLERGDTKTVNAANVDDAGRVIWGGCLLEEGSNELGKIEDTVQIEGEHAGESLGRILVVGGTPVRARVVNQDVELYKIERRYVSRVIIHHRF
jgi:hypothetical protein